MLVYFFSDRNYVRSGFYAHYTVSPCPHNCSANGDCIANTHQCRCFAGYVGRACEHAVCSLACGHHGGHCSETDFTCECPPGRRGFDCGLSVDPSDTAMIGVWSQVSAPVNDVYVARAGHAGVVVDDCLYIFGGTTLNALLNDLLHFCVDDPSWRHVAPSSPWPAARHGHAMAAIDSEIFLYGGAVDHRGSSSSELWVYSIETSRWRLIATSADSNIRVPSLSGHTLTAVDSRYLYVVGGHTSTGQFLSDVHVVTILRSGRARWQRHRSLGGREAHHRLVGHSTIYHR